LTTRVFGTSDARWDAVVEEILQVHNSGRPVLVGTRSIDKSEHLSALLDEVGVEHEVLNARQLAREAEIVAQAGQPGRVTVATNMAGRGTDIKLADQVREIGGLHVILTELHESARIDRQLIGRCGRQGDPGSYRQFLSLDDEILAAGLGHKKAERLQQLGLQSPGPLDHLAPLFRKAQARVERNHFKQRRLLLYHETQRHKIQTQMGQDPYLDTIE
jgi:preprotein translocase subunit SecA